MTKEIIKDFGYELGFPLFLNIFISFHQKLIGIPNSAHLK
jgi:hypothetical protein